MVQQQRITAHSSWLLYLWSLVIVGISTGLSLLALHWIEYQAVGLIELFTVLLVAVYVGRGPALLAAALTGLFWNFLFIPPRFTFAISNAEDILLFCLYFLIAIFTGNLTARLRTQEREAHAHAERTLALYTLAREITNAAMMEEILQIAVTQIRQVFAAQVAILLPAANKQLSQPHPVSTFQMDAQEISVATWVFAHGKRAGQFTDKFPGAMAHYLSLLTPSGTVGVIGVQIQQSQPLSTDLDILLITFVNQIALAIERKLLDEAAEQAAMLQQAERLYTALLSSISHELRTPLAAITGAASSLLDPATGQNEAARTDLAHNIQDAAERLNRLIKNLLDMSRLDSGHLHLKLEWCYLSDLISVAVKRVEKRLASHPLTIHYIPGLPLVRLDFVLIEQVLVNLLENLISHTPAETPVQISTYVAGEYLQIKVVDAGPGMPEPVLEHIFDKFYRGPEAATGGLGLGLSISRGLVEAHGGTLRAENRPERGACFMICLRLGAGPPPVQEAQYG